MPDDDAVIRLAGISVRYGGEVAIGDINLAVQRRSAVALLGPSGCGKTTLLRVISGGLQADGAREVRGRIGIVYQDLKLLPWMTVLDNVLLGAPAGAAARAMQLLQTAGIANKANTYPYELSGGQKQRVAIVRALASGADILLLDEPFSALDFIARARLSTLVGELHRQTGIAMVFVTHDIDDAIRLADRLLVMRSGHIAGDCQNDPGNNAAGLHMREDILRLYDGASAC